MRVSRAHCQAAALAAARQDRSRPAPLHQRRLPRRLPPSHRLRRYPRRSRPHDAGPEQLDLHLGPHSSRRRQRPTPRPHVPADSRRQHRHHLHRHPRSPRVRPQRLPEGSPGGALASVLQHLRHPHLVSVSGDAQSANRSGEAPRQHDGQVPLVRRRLPRRHVLRVAGVCLRSVGRRQRSAGRRRPTSLPLLRHRRHRQRPTEQEAVLPPQTSTDVGLAAAAAALSRAVRRGRR